MRREREGRAWGPDGGQAECDAGGLQSEAQEAGVVEAEPGQEERVEPGGDRGHHGREGGEAAQQRLGHTLTEVR